MKALTIYQPWASLIMVGAKPYEFRSWKPPASAIGERIVIHASARQPDSTEIGSLMGAMIRGGRAAGMCALKSSDDAVNLCGRMIENGPILGAGLGTAIVGEPKPIAEIAEEFGVTSLIYYSSKVIWAWPLLEVEAWAEPVPARGIQRLWHWPSPEDFGL